MMDEQWRGLNEMQPWNEAILNRQELTDRPVTVNQMCRAIGMALVLMKQNRSPMALTDALVNASIIQDAATLADDIEDVLLSGER